MAVSIEYRQDAKRWAGGDPLATSITASWPPFLGIVTEVEKGGVITLRETGEKFFKAPELRSFRTISSTTITVNGKEARLSDIEPGMTAAVKYERKSSRSSVKVPEAIRITALSREDRETTVSGTVVRVGAKDLSLRESVQGGAGRGHEPLLLFQVDGSTIILVDERLSALSAVEPGMAATVKYLPGSKPASSPLQARIIMAKTMEE
jgi:hypothetical protein